MVSTISQLAQATQTGRLLELNTPLGKDQLLINAFSGSEAISGLFHFNLDLLAAKQVAMKDLLGKAVSLSMLLSSLNNSDKRYFHGIVGGISNGSRDQYGVEHYQAEIVPWLWLLNHKADSRIFQNKTALEIIKVVFDEMKGTCPDVNYRDDTIGNYTPLDYCVQYRESDFNFVSRLMQQDGISYFFEQLQDKHTLVLVDHNSKMPVDTKRVLYAEGGLGEDEGIVTHWEERLAVLPGKVSMRDHHFQLPGKDLEVMENSKNGFRNDFEIYDYPGQYALRFKNPDQRLGQVRDEGDKLAMIRMEETESRAHVFNASSTCRQLSSGHQFSFTKHPSCSGDYIIDSLNYFVRQSPDYVSAYSSGANYHNAFTCLPSSVAIRPARVTPKPVISGPQTAIVSVKSGEESWLDKFGRVRVQFHWERKGQNNETSACWVRVAQPWAGASWGAHFWPRLGQEVVVEFLEGDPDRPIITGSVYNKANMPPYTLPDNYTRSGIISRSSKNGQTPNFNELRFEDKNGQEQIFLNAERDMDHRVEHDAREWVGNNQHLVVKAKQTELIEGDKHEHVKAAHVEKVDGNASREIGADHKEKIGGKMSVQVGTEHHEKVGQLFVVETGQEIHLKSGMKIIIESGMQVSIKGAGGFVDIGPSGVTIQGMVVNINSGGSAGSGTSASPDAPDAPAGPEIADDGSKGGKLG